MRSLDSRSSNITQLAAITLLLPQLYRRASAKGSKA